LIQDLDLPPELLQQARSLAALGLAEVAWPRPAALSILEWMRGRRYAVLGGDVLQVSDNRLVHTYDSWHSDPLPAESFETYASRSLDDTLGYLKAYPDREHLYVLVVADRFPGAAT
jgi:hypothetical protein